MKRTLTAKKLLIVSTLSFIVLSILVFIAFNQPQCPDNYTQAQVDATGCVVGANIGGGIFVFVLLPLGFFVVLLWVLAALGMFKEQPAAKKNQKP